MDNTEKYIKQCEKAEKLQRDLVDGDYWCWSGETDVYIARGDGGEHKGGFGTRVILFRQDQLQDLVSPRGYDSEGLNSLLARFVQFVLREYKDKNDMYACSYFPTMEQLWLCFVMRGNYGKVWDGEDWITNV